MRKYDTSATGSVRFFLDGELVELRDVDPTRTVLQFLREDRHRTGTKEGCAEGDCGACTVALIELDDTGEKLRTRAINACIQFLPSIDGKELITVESLLGEDGVVAYDHFGSELWRLPRQSTFNHRESDHDGTRLSYHATASVSGTGAPSIRTKSSAVPDPRTNRMLSGEGRLDASRARAVAAMPVSDTPGEESRMRTTAVPVAGASSGLKPAGSGRPSGTPSASTGGSSTGCSVRMKSTAR